MAVHVSSPTTDITNDFPITVPSSPTSHVVKVDEGIANKDNSDYNQAGGINKTDEYGFGAAPGNMPDNVAIDSADVVLYSDGQDFDLVTGAIVAIFSGGFLKGFKVVRLSTVGFAVLGITLAISPPMTKVQYEQRSVRLTTIDGAFGSPPDFEE